MTSVVNFSQAWEGYRVKGARGRLGLVLVCLALVLPGCGGTARTSMVDGEGAAGTAVLIVATTSVLGDVVRSVVGDDLAVVTETLMPPGSDPHSFEPSARQIEALQGAELVVTNGAGFEEGLLDVIAAAEGDGVAVFRATDHVELLPLAGEHGHDDDAGHADESEHAASGDDPHFFADPARMAGVVRALGEQLAQVSDALTPQEWSERAETYAAELDALDDEIAEQLSGLPEDHRRIVTNHQSFAYFADRYDLTVVGTVIPGGTTLEDPSAADLEALAETIADEGVTAIFAENSSAPALAQALAAETGTDVEVVELFSDSLGEPGSEGATYAGMLRSNARRIAEALA